MNNPIKDFISKINSKKILVIAGNFREFDCFIETAIDLFEKEGKYEGCEFVYYVNSNSVRGMRFDSYCYYGTGINRVGKNISETDLFYIVSSINRQ